MRFQYFKKRRKNISNLNIFAHLIVLLILCNEISTEDAKFKVLEDSLDENSLQSVTKAISDIIRELYIANDIKFDFTIYGNTTKHINDVINGIQTQTIPKSIRHIQDIKTWDHKLSQSAIFLLNSTKELTHLYEKSIKRKLGDHQLTNSIPETFKFLIYVDKEKKFEAIEKKIRSIPHRKISIHSDFTFYEFLIVDNDEKLTLAANVFYSDTKCTQIQLKKLNSFDKITQKWEKELENFEHFENFHNCMINFQMLMQETFFIHDRKNFHLIKISLLTM